MKVYVKRKPLVVALREFVDRKAWDPNWGQTIVFMAGRLHDALPLFTQLGAKPDDIFHHRLVLGVHCLAEITSGLPPLNPKTLPLSQICSILEHLSGDVGGELR